MNDDAKNAFRATVARTSEDRRQVRLHRAFLHVQAVGNLLVEQALGDQRQHPELLGRQAGQAGCKGGVGWCGLRAGHRRS